MDGRANGSDKQECTAMFGEKRVQTNSDQHQEYDPSVDASTVFIEKGEHVTLGFKDGDKYKFDEDHVDSVSSESSSNEARETWSHGLDFILSLLGYAVGLGNLWRFPYLCMRNGGGAFLIPFLTCLILCGMPLFFLEVSLGQFLGRSSLHAWIICPLFTGLGIGMMIVSSVFALYYNMIMAWSLYYLARSFTSSLPWSSCDGHWNTDNCFVKGHSSEDVTNATGLANSTTGMTTTASALLSNATLSMVPANVTTAETMSSEEEFWQYNVLQISSGLHETGNLPWHLAVSLLVAWIIVFFCVMKGVHSIGKVVYVTATLPYILLTILLVKGLTLDGSLDGIVYYLKPDVNKMMNARVWIEAALQVFYSLGPGWGPLISMASFNKFNNNCLRDTLVICFIGEGTSIFSGLVVFTILGFIAHELHLPIEDVVKSGPGLGFVAYPQALARLPVPTLWSILFFIMLILVGLDSQFSTVESLIAGMVDLFPKLRKRRLSFSLVMCAIGFLLGLPMCFQSGIYIFQLIDWYVAIFAVPVFGTIECLIVAWIYGADRYSSDVELMLGRQVPIIIRICWCFITPIALIICLIFTLMTYQPPTYGDYEYPAWGQALGWIIATLPIIPLPIIALKQLMKNRNQSFKKRLADSVSPSIEYRPRSHQYQKGYSLSNYSRYAGITPVQRIKLNVTGK